MVNKISEWNLPVLNFSCRSTQNVNRGVCQCESKQPKNTEMIEIFGIGDVKYFLVWKSRTYLLFAMSIVAIARRVTKAFCPSRKVNHKT